MRVQQSIDAAVIISGGVAHDFSATSMAVAEVLAEVDVHASVETDVEHALLGLSTSDAPRLVVLNLLRWRMQVERYAHLRDEWGIELSAAARDALVAYLRRGGGLLALHGASICFDDWVEWKDVLGGRWVWERSWHPEITDDPVHVSIADSAHPIVAGAKDFEIIDEVYGFLDLAADVRGLLTSTHSGTSHPLLWAREFGQGRVVYDALGHDQRSFQHPEHRLILQRAARWAMAYL